MVVGLMRKMFSVLVALSFVLFFYGANAFSEMDVEFPEKIYLSGKKSFDVSIFNPSFEEQDLSVRLFVPQGMDYEISGLPEKISAESRDSFRLTLKPRSEVLGTHYIATISVELGNEKVLKLTKIHFSDIEGGEEGQGIEPFLPIGAFFFGFTENGELMLNALLLLIAVVLFVVFLIKLRKR